MKHTQCHECRFAGGDPDKRGKTHCYYAGITNISCLYRKADGSIADRRGPDPDNCLLFVKGKRFTEDTFRDHRGVGKNFPKPIEK